MKIKLIIANRIVVNDIMRIQENDYAVIGITNPFPDPLNYFVLSNKFKGLLKIEFEDSDPVKMHDPKMLFSEKKKESIVKFTEAMILNGVSTMIVHCDKGKHRSVAVAMKLRDIYTEKGYSVDLVNIDNDPEPNEHIISVFGNTANPHDGHLSSSAICDSCTHSTEQSGGLPSGK